MKIVETKSEVQATLLSQLFTSTGVSYLCSYHHNSGLYIYNLIAVCGDLVEDDESLLKAIKAVMSIENYD